MYTHAIRSNVYHLQVSYRPIPYKILKYVPRPAKSFHLNGKELT